MLNKIAAETGDYEKYGIIMPIIWQALETDGRSWKQTFKALSLIDFLIKNGSERVIEASRDKLYKIKCLQDFSYYEANMDKGSGVREKSKQIVELLGDNEMIRSERDKARTLRNKFSGFSGSSSNNSYGGQGGGGNDSYSSGGRYGGDSYSDRKTSESSSKGFGGGVYDSRSSGRYSDEPPQVI
jgi:epsin